LAASFGFGCVCGGCDAAGARLCGGAVFDVPRVADECQLAVHAQLQYRCAGLADTAGVDFLFDLCSFEKVFKPRMNAD